MPLDEIRRARMALLRKDAEAMRTARQKPPAVPVVNKGLGAAPMEGLPKPTAIITPPAAPAPTPLPKPTAIITPPAAPAAAPLPAPTNATPVPPNVSITHTGPPPVANYVPENNLAAQAARINGTATTVSPRAIKPAPANLVPESNLAAQAAKSPPAPANFVPESNLAARADRMRGTATFSPAPSGSRIVSAVKAAPRVMANSAVPTLAAEFAAAIDAKENPAHTTVSDRQIQMMAEEDPVGAQLTFGKDRVTQAMAAPPEPPKPKSTGPTVVRYGEYKYKRLPASKTAPAKPAAPAAPAAPQPPKTQAERIAAAGVPQGRNVITGEAPSTTEAAPTGEVFVSKGSRPGGGMEARRYVVEGVKGSASGIAPVGRTGGFAGSATDAEAARNLQARAEQDQAARFMADSMNRGAEAERDTRAAKLGVSRGVLDRMEGRDTAAGRASATAQGQVDTPTPGVFDRPGDGYGDAQLREVQFNTLLDDAGKQTGRGSRQRAAAKIQAAMAMLQPGLSAIEADTAQRKNTAELQAAQVNQMGELEKSRMQEAGLNQRAQATNATNLDSARITQAGGLRREAMQQQGLDERVRTGNMKDVFKQGADYLTKATSPDGKNPPQVSPEKLARARAALNYAQLAEQVGEDAAKRIKSGAVTAEEAQQLVAMARQWDDNPASIWNLWTATAQPPSYIPQ